jgi:ABC-type transport system involved in multi-copper enzyme maturation permease subunit
MAGVVIREMCRRKDFYVMFILTVVLVLTMGSLNFFNDDNIVRYLKELCLLLIWMAAFVIAVTAAARQIPAEIENRTLFPLLAKPVTRDQVVWGKFLGCWLACGLALIVFYVFFACLSASREHTLPLAAYWQAFCLHWFLLAIITAGALLGSLIFAAPSSNATICFVLIFAVMVLGRHLHRIALGLTEPASTLVYLLYYLLPHLELFDVRDLIIHNWEPVPWVKCLLVVAYGSAYAAIFLVLGCLVFRRKTLQ